MTTAPFEWTHEKTHVAYDGSALSIDGTRFPIDQIERLARIVLHSKAQGSWNRLTCDVSVHAGGVTGRATFRGDAGTPEWGPWRPLWDQLDAMVRDEIQTRLLARTLDSALAGSPVELVSTSPKGRGRVVVTADAFKLRRPFAKPVPWSSITDVTTPVSVYQLHVANAAGKVKTQLTGVEAGEWDAWQLPLLWAMLRDR